MNTNPTSPTNPTKTPTGEPRLASVVSWAVLAASFGLSASTWIALAVLAGFTAHLSMFGLVLRLAWLMPIAVDGYVVVALVLWMSPVPNEVASFARKNTYIAAGIGIAAQSAYHALTAWSTTEVIWRTILAAVVGTLSPAVAGLAVHMRALLRREADRNAQTAAIHVAASLPVLSIEPQPIPAVAPVPATPMPAPAAPDVTAAPPVSVPTPAEVASRITFTAPRIDRADRGPMPMPTAPASRPRPTTSQTSPDVLVPPAIDISVTEPAATQPTTSIVSPTLIARATEVARQHATDTDTPITPGQLAVRLKVTTALATQILAAIDTRPASTSPVPALNGHHVATR